MRADVLKLQRLVSFVRISDFAQKNLVLVKSLMMQLFVTATNLVNPKRCVKDNLMMAMEVFNRNVTTALISTCASIQSTFKTTANPTTCADVTISTKMNARRVKDNVTCKERF